MSDGELASAGGGEPLGAGAHDGPESDVPLGWNGDAERTSRGIDSPMGDSLQANDRNDRRRRRLLGLVLVTILVLPFGVGVVVALRGREPQQVWTVDLAQAADAATASTARVEVVQGLEGGMTTTAEGEIDFENRRARLRFVPGGGSEAQTIPETATVSLPRELEVLAGSDELVTIDDRVYLHSGDGWYDMGPSDQNGLDLWSATSILEQIGALGAVTSIGSEQVRGAPATHYRASDQSTGETYDVWVDNIGRVVRLKTTTKDGEPASPQYVTMELFDFGLPVTIDVPPDAEPPGVTTVPEAGRERVGR